MGGADLRRKNKNDQNALDVATDSIVELIKEITARRGEGTSAADGLIRQSSLKKQVTCALCLDVFTEPTMLPCSHTFCTDCLKNLARTSNSIACPSCRARHDLTGG